MILRRSGVPTLRRGEDFRADPRAEQERPGTGSYRVPDISSLTSEALCGRHRAISRPRRRLPHPTRTSAAWRNPAIQLPSPDWVHQPKIPGQITDRISVHKTGPGSDARELRVEGASQGATGYWSKALTAPSWTFVPTGLPLTGAPLENPGDDRSRDTLAPVSPYDFSGNDGDLTL
ncbi:hypothetical protein AB0D08_18825 [Kitasatospora sp. NPDC048540]|uniref:hypothetical protein n=1 Tax=Kitasatospora sp. NPDC048540 TaxID=3155634 RepID=UPI0033F7F492